MAIAYLRDRRWNSAHTGGEGSTGSPKGCRVLSDDDGRCLVEGAPGWARCARNQGDVLKTYCLRGKYMEEFEVFWKSYPKKLAKGDARKAWKQTEKIRPPFDKLIKSVVVAKASEQWRKDGGSFIPYPATWLRGERWEDVHEVELDMVKDGKAWHETVDGIEKRAKQLGMEWNTREETFQQFARRVKHASDASNVVPIARSA